MATELRRIVFANHEVIEAIRGYNDLAKKKLPAASVVSCRIDGADGTKVTLEMRNEASDKQYRVSLKTSFIGAALMKWCLVQEIPMARSAEKTLEVVGDNLSIAMTINLHADELVESSDSKDGMPTSERAKAAEAAA